MQSELPATVESIIVSVQRPAKIFTSQLRWDPSATFTVDGTVVEGNDTPWLSLADILVDADKSTFIGLTFQLSDPGAWHAARVLADALDPRVVKYSELSAAHTEHLYPGEVEVSRRFEVFWAMAHNVRCEIAQLTCGQWFWWYEQRSAPTHPPRLIAVGITDVQDVLTDHQLRLPTSVDLPMLNAKCR